MTSLFISLLKKKKQKSSAPIVISLCERAKTLYIYFYFKKPYANSYFQMMSCDVLSFLFLICMILTTVHPSVCLEVHNPLWLVFYATGTFFSCIYVFVTLLGLYCKVIMNEQNAVLADLYWLWVFTSLLSVICNTIKCGLHYYKCTFKNTF